MIDFLDFSLDSRSRTDSSKTRNLSDMFYRNSCSFGFIEHVAKIANHLLGVGPYLVYEMGI
jgi:hypothetical protein